MSRTGSLIAFLIAALSISGCRGGSWEYCIVGAGPAGLQMAALLHNAQRDYVLFERNSAPGSFFVKYPRHRVLNTINRMYHPTDGANATQSERSLRVDQHSLFESPRVIAPMRGFSQDYHPHADDYVAYLNDFASRLALNVKYNSDAMIRPKPSGGYIVSVSGSNHTCDVVFVATGIDVPRQAHAAHGLEHIDTYDKMSIDPEDYTNKSVVILGYGNSAFETGKALASTAGHVWLVGTRRIRIASETFYEGDVRSHVSDIFDSYHLKSLDALAEQNFGSPPSLVKDGEFFKLMSPGWVMSFKALQRDRLKREAKKAYKSGAEGAHAARFIQRHPEIGRKYLELRAGYSDDDKASWSTDLWRSHKVISCFGFMFNDTIFTGRPPCVEPPAECPPAVPNKHNDSIRFSFLSGRVAPGPLQGQGENDMITSRERNALALAYPDRTFPEMSDMFESREHPGLFFLGSLMHGDDWHQSAGGFIHGFRHLALGLHHFIERERHGKPWPSTPVLNTPEAITAALVTRASNAASMVSMPCKVFDLLLLGEADSPGVLYTDVPRGAVSWLLPPNSTYLTLTFNRSRSSVDDATTQRLRDEREKTIAHREKLQQLDITIEAFERESEELGPERYNQSLEAILQRESALLNLQYEKQKYSTGMLSDHNTFHKGRHATKPEDAAMSHSLHPVISWACGEAARPAFHLLESSDHDYGSIEKHVLPLLSEISKGLSACGRDATISESA